MKQILFALLPLAIFLAGCGKQKAIISAHNQMVAIESAMVDSYNAATSAAEQAAAVKAAVNSMQKIDVSSCPPDYQTTWQEVMQLWTRWETALNSGDIVLADQLAKQSPGKTSTLNGIAKSHGIEITD